MAVAALGVDVAQHALQPRLRSGEAELLGGGVLQVVRLVDDQMAVLRQHPVARGHVGQQQRMVGDQQVGAVGLAAVAVEETAAALAFLAALVAAPTALRGQARPDCFLAPAPQKDLGPVAGGCLRQPDQHARQHPQLVVVQIGPAAHGVQPPRAEVVGAALDQRHPQPAGLAGELLKSAVAVDRLAAQPLEDRQQVGHVLGVKLVLQVDGVGADHDPAAVLHRPGDGRQQVGQALAGAGAGLDQQVVAVVEGVGHGAQHLHLWLAVLVARQGLGQRAVRLQEAGQQFHVDRRRLLGGRQLGVEAGRR